MNRPRYPDTFLCGAPKCATTSLAHALASHPGIFVPVVKEPCYFAPGFPGIEDVVGNNVDRYRALYASARKDQRLLDASVGYLFWDSAIAELLRVVPDPRFICVFRPPLDLFISWHAHLLRSDLEDEPDPERAWRLVSERRKGKHLPPGLRDQRILDYERFCSLGTQCRALFDLVASERVLVLTFEEVTERWPTARARLLDFLGLADAPLPLQRSNAGRIPHWPDIDRIRRRVARQAGLLKRSLGIKRRFGLIERFYQATSSALPRRSLSPAFLDDFERVIAPDMALLNDLTGICLPLRAS